MNRFALAGCVLGVAAVSSSLLACVGPDVDGSPASPVAATLPTTGASLPTADPGAPAAGAKGAVVDVAGHTTTLGKRGNRAVVINRHPGGALAWTCTFGDAASGRDTVASAVAVDAARNVYVTGTFTGTFSLPAPIHQSGAGQNMFVAKLDRHGQALWAIDLGEGSGYAVAVDAAGNVAVGGKRTSGSAGGVVVLLREDGTTAWSRTFGEPTYEDVRGVAFDRRTSAIYAWGGAGREAFAAKLDATMGGDEAGLRWIGSY